MTTLSDPVSHLSLPQLQEAFLAIRPRLLRHARFYFRHVRCHQRRADRIAEMIGLCWKWFRSMARRGKDARLFVCALAGYAARAVNSGRRICGQQKSRDVLSPLAQRRHGFRVEALPATTRTHYEDRYHVVNGQRRIDFLEERLRDNTVSPVPDQVAFRVDFVDWLATFAERDRRLIGDLAREERTLDLARKYGVSPGRISQLRRKYLTDWRRFCDDIPARPA